jgi:hypothetical protein
MPWYLNPFQKHDVSEFEGVFQPLGESQRQGSVVAAHEDTKSLEKDGDSEKAPHSYEYSANTIEGLRAEIESDVAASGHDSVYDRT